MKKLAKSVMLLFLCLTFVINSNAQDPNFTIKWDGCDLGTTNYSHSVTYAIVDVTTNSVVAGPYNEEVLYPYVSCPATVYNWDCDQTIETKHYMLVIHVEYWDENGNVICSGDLRTNILPCSDLYNGNIYTVLLN